MDRTVSVAQAKNQFSDLLNRVIYRNERIIVTKRGKPVGAIVALGELKSQEDENKRRLLKRAKAVEKSTQKYIPFKQFVREYEKKWGVDLGLFTAEDLNVRD